MLPQGQRERFDVVLVSPRNPLNIGAAARAMANFGFRRLTVVAPFDATWREARSAVGAPELLENAKSAECLAEAVADCTLVVGTGTLTYRRPEQPVVSLPLLAPLVRRELADGGRVALVFGSEKHGLTREDLSYCHVLVEIPTDPEQPSMNLGQAVAVCLYELAARGALLEKLGLEVLAGMGTEVGLDSGKVHEEHLSGALQAAEKGLTSSKIEGMHPSGAEAHVDIAVLAARLKSCPFKTWTFSAACKAHASLSAVSAPFDGLRAGFKSCPDTMQGPPVACGAAGDSAEWDAEGDDAAYPSRSAEPAATSGRLELLAGLIEEAMEGVGYSPRAMQPANRHDLRLLLRRLSLSAHDTRRILGLFRRILWRLKRAATPDKERG